MQKGTELPLFPGPPPKTRRYEQVVADLRELTLRDDPLGRVHSPMFPVMRAVLDKHISKEREELKWLIRMTVTVESKDDKVERLARALNSAPRYARVVYLFARGFTFQDIAKELAVQPRSVYKYLYLVRRKFNLRTNVELVRWVDKVVGRLDKVVSKH